MKTVNYLILCLLVLLYAYPAGADSVGADYCVMVCHESGQQWLLRVRSDSILSRIQLDIQDTPKCNGRHFIRRSTAAILDLGEKETGIEQFKKNGDLGKWRKDIFSMTAGIGERWTYHIPSLVANESIDLPVYHSNAHVEMLPGSRYNRGRNLLSFENKIVDAYKGVRLECQGHLDTTFLFKFRVRITGECKQ